jgi:hypothetical protein
MKKRSPSSEQNGQLVHWWLLVHSCLKNRNQNRIPGSTFVWDQNQFKKTLKTGTGICSIHTSQEPLNTGRVLSTKWEERPMSTTALVFWDKGNTGRLLGTKWEEKEFETYGRHAPLPLALLG